MLNGHRAKNQRALPPRGGASIMSTLENRTNSALVVIDVQNGVVADAWNREGVIENIVSLVEKARASDVPVIWVQHTEAGNLDRGTDDWQFVKELVPAEHEVRIEKQYGDSFEGTNLESVLADLAVGKLIVTGAQTDQCVRSTIHGAFTRGYDTFLVTDAHTTSDLSEYGAPTPDKVIAHTNMYWRYMDGVGKVAGTMATESVEFC
jgi:nicotinamidase-related amidase